MLWIKLTMDIPSKVARRARLDVTPRQAATRELSANLNIDYSGLGNPINIYTDRAGVGGFGPETLDQYLAVAQAHIKSAFESGRNAKLEVQETANGYHVAARIWLFFSRRGSRGLVTHLSTDDEETIRFFAHMWIFCSHLLRELSVPYIDRFSGTAGDPIKVAEMLEGIVEHEIQRGELMYLPVNWVVRDSSRVLPPRELDSHMAKMVNRLNRGKVHIFGDRVPDLDIFNGLTNITEIDLRTASPRDEVAAIGRLKYAGVAHRVRRNEAPIRWIPPRGASLGSLHERALTALSRRQFDHLKKRYPEEWRNVHNPVF